MKPLPGSPAATLSVQAHSAVLSFSSRPPSRSSRSLRLTPHLPQNVQNPRPFPHFPLQHLETFGHFHISIAALQKAPPFPCFQSRFFNNPALDFGFPWSFGFCHRSLSSPQKTR